MADYARMVSTGRRLLLITWNAAPVLKLSNQGEVFARLRRDRIAPVSISQKHGIDPEAERAIDSLKCVGG